MTNDKAELPDDERLEAVLAFAFCGIHHCGTIKKPYPGLWEINHSGELSTFDFDELTKLVYAAHKYAVRVSIGSSGPRMVKIILHARKRTGSFCHRHPTITETIEQYSKKERE